MEKNKKICFVSIKSYPLFNQNCQETFGGAEVQIYNISNELSKFNDFTVSVVVGDYNQKNMENYSFVNVYKAYKLKKNFLNYVHAPLKLFETLRNINPDIVICRGHGPEVGFCAFYKNILGYDLFYSIAHDKDVLGNNFKGIMGKMFKYGFKNTDKLIFQSKTQTEIHKRRFNSDLNNPIIINSSYNISNMEEISQDYILWVGRSDEWKQPEILLEVAKYFPEEKFIMIMPKSSNLKKWNEINSKAKNLNNLELIEKVPFKDVQNYFNKAKLYINTSKYEGFPNTFIQSGIGKTPIISLNVNPDNILDKFQIGFFCKNDFENLINNLENILKDNGLYKKYSLNILDYVKKNHDIKKNIEKWKKII